MSITRPGEPEGQQPLFREGEPAPEEPTATGTISPEQLQLYYDHVEANPANLEAWYWIGYCFQCAEGGVEKNYEEAQRIWRAALRDHGNDDDIHDNAGKIRYMINHNDPKCVSRLEWEAAQGSSQSQLFLGSCFVMGVGALEEDHVQAFNCWHRSAERGNVDALLEIAGCYWYGDGVEQDLVKAVELFDKAIAQGNDDARTSRQHLIDELSVTEEYEVLGCVQRNRWLENVRRSMELMPPLGIWALALGLMFEFQDKWASLSPAFLCLKQVIPALSETGMKRKRV